MYLVQSKCAFLRRNHRPTLLIELGDCLGHVPPGQVLHHLLLPRAEDPREDLDQVARLHVVHALHHPWQEQPHPEQGVALEVLLVGTTRQPLAHQCRLVQVSCAIVKLVYKRRIRVKRKPLYSSDFHGGRVPCTHQEPH